MSDTNDLELIRRTAEWVSRRVASNPGLSGSKSLFLEAGRRLLQSLSAGRRMDRAPVDCLHGAVSVLIEPEFHSEKHSELVELLLSQIESNELDPDEQAELEARAAFAGWKVARSNRRFAAADHWVSRVAKAVSKGPCVERVKSLSLNEAFSVEDCEIMMVFPEELMATRELLLGSIESFPGRVMRRAAEIHEALREAVGWSSDEEQAYFVGAFAYLAGTAARVSGSGDQGRRWLDQAESAFRSDPGGELEIARCAYQRLAIEIHERKFGKVLLAAPLLAQRFREMEVPQDELKCAFLEAVVYKESGQWESALPKFEELARRCDSTPNGKMRVSAYVNLIQLHSDNGDEDAAVGLFKRALPLMRQLDDRVAEVRTRWGLAMLLSQRGRVSEAVQAFLGCDAEYTRLEMPRESASTRLVVAELLLQKGREIEAVAIVLSALPIIEILEMQPEAIAAVALLRESGRRNKLDRAALRALCNFLDKPDGTG